MMRLCHAIRNVVLVILLTLMVCGVAPACSQQSATPVTSTQPPDPPVKPENQPPSAPANITSTPTPKSDNTTPPQPPVMEKGNVSFTLTSTAFKEGSTIPVKYACPGEDFSPPLAWQNAPSGTRSFAIIVDDPEGFNWIHWLIFNLPPDITMLPENIKKVGKLDNGALQGSNSFGNIGYGGPCPPSRHHYYYTIYALDTMLDLREGINKGVLMNRMEKNILGKATLMGAFP